MSDFQQFLYVIVLYLQLPFVQVGVRVHVTAMCEQKSTQLNFSGEFLLVLADFCHRRWCRTDLDGFGDYCSSGLVPSM